MIKRMLILEILILTFLPLQAQLSYPQSTIVKLNNIQIQIDDVIYMVQNEHELNEHSDTAYLYLELGEGVQGIKLQILSSDLQDIKIEQQYQTSLTITNEGPHVDLLEWKHHTSEWAELELTEHNTIKTHSYAPDEEARFPEFTEKELIEYLQSIGREDYAKLITRPEYPEGKHWEIGISSIILRISGNEMINKAVYNYIIFEIPMGC